MHIQHTVNSHRELPIKHKALIYKSNSLSTCNTQLSGIIYYCRILHALVGSRPSCTRRRASDRGGEEADILVLAAGLGGHFNKYEKINKMCRSSFHMSSRIEVSPYEDVTGNKSDTHL